MPTNAPVAGPESIVTSLHWSRQLEKAGWPQDKSIYWWLYNSDYDKHWVEPRSDYRNFPGTAAHTAEELLRKVDDVHAHAAFLDWQKGKYKTLADSVAAMCCYLAENGLLPKA